MPSAPGNLRLTNRSVIVAVGLLGLTLLLMRLLSSSTRVLGWVAVAAIGAALLFPLVARLDRRLPRGVAVAAAVLGTAAVLGLLAYLGIDAVSEQARRLQREAPRAAARVEESERFGEPAQEFELREKVQSFVDELPDRLRGGTPAEALRANATRGVAFLAT
ncbi:MAG: AI-2E family transporter, partial [Acidimicrobiales bacterium]